MPCITAVVLLLCLKASATTYSGSASDNIEASRSASLTTSEFIDRYPSTTSASAPGLSVSTKTLQGNEAVFAPDLSPDTCPSRTVNYITHTLPQQCLRTSRGVHGNVPPTKAFVGDSSSIVNGTITAQVKEEEVTKTFGTAAVADKHSTQSIAAIDSSQMLILEDSSPLGLEDEQGSPLDNSKFLSFEEWKKQNLAKVGQSPENIGQGRVQGNEGRRRPITNALDSLGEEGEIDLDFGGFGGSSPRYTAGASTAAKPAADRSTEKQTEHTGPAKHKSKDAGKTCKERFNYASFDCAATVMKTNPKCKSYSSVLVENKDSYMLNECSVDNKFIIIELCDDILVDTVVVANFEFFSSMFRTFRVSVSDRYPAKIDRWKDLGTFEARNSRDIQAFLVVNPQIWARYLRIEFLTHYGSEYYCPVSLIRVHGTTMMEEFRHQEDVARGEDEDVEELISDTEVATSKPSDTLSAESASLTIPQQTNAVGERSEALLSINVEKSTHATTLDTAEDNITSSKSIKDISQNSTSEIVANSPTSVVRQQSHSTPTVSRVKVIESEASEAYVRGLRHDEGKASSQRMSDSSGTQVLALSSKSTIDIKSADISTAPSPSSDSVDFAGSNNTQKSKHTTNTTDYTTHHSDIRSVSTGSSSILVSERLSKTAGAESTKAQAPPQPSTQDSFFKATNKRLTMLETNSSLNIQYIEEQSRILRDAFVQTEKHQLKKTENFLKHLNDTVMAELKGFRTQYDQLWQSTVIELEESRARSQREMTAFSTRLTMLADELVWAKRMNAVQSILLLASLGLFVFALRGNEYIEMPIMQQALRKSQSVLRFKGSRSRSYGSPSPPRSPKSAQVHGSEVRHRLRELGGDTSLDMELRLDSHNSDADSPLVAKTAAPQVFSPTAVHVRTVNPGLQFEPPTPRASVDGHSDGRRSASPTLSSEEAAKAIARGARSGPATPSGSRENQPIDWNSPGDEVDSPPLPAAMAGALSSLRG